jgi:EF-P beta-lysylation protein EpmB
MMKSGMIPRTGTIWQTKSWQQALSDCVSSLDELFSLLEIKAGQGEEYASVYAGFALRVPRSFVQRMEKGNIADPLLLQILPRGKELDCYPGFNNDPLDEQSANPLPGLIHKYHGRLLLIVTGSCAIHCRYCFRRHFPYSDNNPGFSHWQPVMDYIAADPSIKEVILSGGDPLAAPDSALAGLVESIAAIAHVERLRIHTRLPIVIPQRITPQCLAWLTASRLKTIMVIHCNHPREINAEVAQALLLLKQQGITLLNQTVVLKGINDCVNTLVELSETLFNAGVLPYYLHLLDRVSGAAHFEVSETEAKKLLAALRVELPGYLVPALVKEEAGARHKTPIAPL